MVDGKSERLSGVLRRADAALAASAAASIRMTIAMDGFNALLDDAADAAAAQPSPPPAPVARVRWTRRSIIDAGGRAQLLTDTEWRLLHILVRSRGRTLGYEELVDRLWGGGVQRRAELAVYISRLRRKFGGERQSVIATVRGGGYRFLSELSGETDGPSS
ncbi:MAG: helix-turn-helix domain-containing protein [Candidatus Dormibacteraeota bacterium]|nr:helix-turn-helix domain-containing protein [Candidatus Dormibacteraeota bacterium]